MTTILCDPPATEARRSLDDVKPKRSEPPDSDMPELDWSSLDLSMFDLSSLDLSMFNLPALDAPTLDVPVPVVSTLDLPAFSSPVLSIPALDSPAQDIPTPDLQVLDATDQGLIVTDLPAIATPVLDSPVLDTPVVDTPAPETPASVASAPEASTTVKPRTASTREELALLAIKIGVVAIMVGLFFTFLYGLRRCGDADMTPAVKDGDITLICRWDKSYLIGDLVALKVNGVNQVRRVVAEPGDIVDITSDGLFINGQLQEEPNAQQTTIRYAQGPGFPLTVGPNQIFVLGDARENATDSRVYGPVNVKDTLGKVIGIIRMRDL